MNMNINMPMQAIIGLIACAGFCILVNVPKKAIIPATLTGSIAWFVYQFAMSSGYTKPLAAFIATCIVTLVSDILSRKVKEAATVFIIPGILPLVPGSSMYYTMTYIISSDFEMAGKTGTQTLFTAGSIALAILIVGSFLKIFTTIRHKIYWN